MKNKYTLRELVRHAMDCTNHSVKVVQDRGCLVIMTTGDHDLVEGLNSTFKSTAPDITFKSVVKECSPEHSFLTQ